MPSSFMRAVRERTGQALASGDLRPVETRQLVIEDGGLPFVVRWAASLARKDAASPQAGAGATPVMPGGPRDPTFNPFLDPEPALTIGPMGDEHTVILNKFPVCEHHLVLARREFAEQLAPLDAADFRVLAELLSGQGGLGFYNGGPAAGASQRHKHVQWIPSSPDNASLARLAPGLPTRIAPGGLARHGVLPFAHRFARVEAGPGVEVATSARSLAQAFEAACAELGLVPGADRLMPPFNLLVDAGWLLVVPRSRERFEGVSLNALSFGGTLYVREIAQLDILRRTGPLRALASVALPAAQAAGATRDAGARR